MSAYFYRVEFTNSLDGSDWKRLGGLPFHDIEAAINMAENNEHYYGTHRHYRVVDNFDEVVWDCYFAPERFVVHSPHEQNK